MLSGKKDLMIRSIGHRILPNYAFLWKFFSTFVQYSLQSSSLEMSSHIIPNFLQPNCQSKPHKEGAESEQFWGLLGGKSEYPSQKIARNNESDPHLFSCTFAKGVYNYISIVKCTMLFHCYHFLLVY